MSRILGRAIDVLQVVNYLQESEIPKYNDKSLSTWEDIENIPNKLKIFLPESAIDFISQKKISIKKNPLRKYTFTSVPEYDDEERYIVFPSTKPKKKFERDYAFYIGLLLSSYQIDTQEELLETGKEYDDLLPLLLDCLSLKADNKENDFSLKPLNDIKHFSKYYGKIYKRYQDFFEFSSNAETANLNDTEYNNFIKLIEEKDEEMERLTMEDIIKLSSLDATLQIIDKNLTVDEYKKLIEELTINKNENRSFILSDLEINSFGYKRLRKEIDKYKKR